MSIGAPGKEMGGQGQEYMSKRLNIALNTLINPYLGGGFKDFLFSPRNLGKISNLTNIFQMG